MSTATTVKVSKEDVIGFIENMTVLELSGFVKELEGKFGVSAASIAVASAPAGAAPAAAAEEKTEFDIVLKAVPADKKIQVIKVVRAITSLGLKEAKDLVEAAPKPLKSGVKKQEADEIKKQVEEAGGSIEIK